MRIAFASSVPAPPDIRHATAANNSSLDIRSVKSATFAVVISGVQNACVIERRGDHEVIQV